MKWMLLHLLVLFSFGHILLAQNQSGSGTISNYQIFCSGSSDQCISADNGADTITIAPQINGEIKVTVTLTGGSVTCCDGQIFPQVIGATLRNAYNNQVLYTFQQNGTSETTRSCVGPQDSFLLVISGSKGEYQYQVETTSSLYPPEENDYDNDDPFTSDPLQPNSTGLGTIGYGNVSTDLDDWYYIGVDNQGKLNLAIEIDGRANFFLKRLNFTDLDVVYFFVPGKDTLMVDCVAPGDTFFIQVAAQSNQCANYSVTYWVDAPGGNNDMESNDDIDSASYVTPNTMHKGRIGFGIYDRDLDDVYLIVADDDGEFRLDLEGGTFAYKLYSKTLSPLPLAYGVVEDGQDSIIIDCVAELDSFYLLIEEYSSNCSDYSFGYFIAPPLSANDSESEEESLGFQMLSASQPVEGRIGFGFYDLDLEDRFLITAEATGCLQVIVETFEEGAQFFLRRADNQLKIDSSILTGAETDTLKLDCVAIGDTFFVDVQPFYDNNFEAFLCTTYRLMYSVNNFPSNPPDNAGDDASSASTLLDVPGNLSGVVGYGYYDRDQEDVYLLTEMEVNDKPEFQFLVEKDSLRFRLERFSLGLGVVNDFGFISGIESKDFTIGESGLYFLRVSYPGCASYEVDVGGLLSHVKINGTDLFGAYSAGGSIQVSNSTVCDVTLTAPEVQLLPILFVPLGCTLDVFTSPE